MVLTCLDKEISNCGTIFVLLNHLSNTFTSATKKCAFYTHKNDVIKKTGISFPPIHMTKKKKSRILDYYEW